MTLKKNDEITLAIESVTSEGSGLGRFNGFAVFVRGAVAGDVILTHIIKVSKSYAVGIIKEIISPSGDRIEPDCSVSDKCGGCSLRSMTYDAELRFKKSFVEENLARIGHIHFEAEEIIGADCVDNYRNKAQYPVFCGENEFFAGFYAYKSHRIIPISYCRLQPKEFEKGIKAFEKWALKNNITSYDEKTGRGLLRHIYFRKAFATGEIMACAVINGENIPDKDYLVECLLQAFENLKSIVVNINRKNTNVILGDRTKTVWGSSKITDILLGKRFVISPESFYQVNHAQCERLYAAAADFAGLTGSETVLDMYCGAGTIGITLADKCRRLIGIEAVKSAVENARENAALNGIDNAEFICADAYDGAKEITKRGIKPDIVILDPPRKGCQKEIFDLIESLGIERIVYVSCNSATLARDIEILNEKGYELKRLKAVDLFPRTPHVECCAMLCRTQHHTSAI